MIDKQLYYENLLELLPAHLESNNLEEFKKIIDNAGEEKVNRYKKNNWFIQALRENKTHFVKYLIDIGANIETIDRNYQRPLTIMSENGHLDVVQHLVKKGVNIHADNDSALIGAADYNRLDIVQFFIIECGCNIDYVLKNVGTSQNILDWAFKYKDSLALKEKMNLLLDQKDLTLEQHKINKQKI